MGYKLLKRSLSQNNCAPNLIQYFKLAPRSTLSKNSKRPFKLYSVNRIKSYQNLPLKKSILKWRKYSHSLIKKFNESQSNNEIMNPHSYNNDEEKISKSNISNNIKTSRTRLLIEKNLKELLKPQEHKYMYQRKAKWYDQRPRLMINNYYLHNFAGDFSKAIEKNGNAFNPESSKMIGITMLFSSKENNSELKALQQLEWSKL